MTTTKYAIIGGGIVGASVAYHLSERTDDPVTVYERDELASETTFKSTAMVGEGGTDPHRRMKQYGFRLYNEFFADPAATPQYRQSGRLRVATSPDGARRLKALAGDGTGRTDDPLAETFAHSLTEYIPGDEVQDSLLVPPLDTERIDGALYRPKYGHILGETSTLGAQELAYEFIERARDNGVTFQPNTEVTDVHTNDGRVTGIETGDERIEADEVICAAGSWNSQLVESVGIDLPIEHALAPVYAMELDTPLSYTLPTIKSHESAVGIHEKRDDVLFVTYTPGEEEGKSSYDPAAVGEAELDMFRDKALRWAERLLPRVGDAELGDEWVGVGTGTPDDNPILGWTAIEGLSLAVTMSGIQLAPAVGSILARQLVDGDPTEYYESVSIARFDGYTDWYRDGGGA